MQLSEQDEDYYRQCCMDMAFDLGFDVLCKGGQAYVRFDQSDAEPVVVSRPTNSLFFWEETWYALRRDFYPNPPARVAEPLRSGSTSLGMGDI